MGVVPDVTSGFSVHTVNGPMSHTMGAVARIAGVTVRTLHHYDEMAQYLHDAIKANAARKGL